MAGRSWEGKRGGLARDFCIDPIVSNNPVSTGFPASGDERVRRDARVETRIGTRAGTEACSARARVEANQTFTAAPQHRPARNLRVRSSEISSAPARAARILLTAAGGIADPKKRDLVGREARIFEPPGLGGMWDACRVPFVPELFSAPVLERIEDKWRLDELVAVPYFDGLMAGSPTRWSSRSPASPSCTTPCADASWARERSRRSSRR